VKNRTSATLIGASAMALCVVLLVVLTKGLSRNALQSSARPIDSPIASSLTIVPSGTATPDIILEGKKAAATLSAAATSTNIALAPALAPPPTATALPDGRRCVVDPGKHFSLLLNPGWFDNASIETATNDGSGFTITNYDLNHTSVRSGFQGNMIKADLYVRRLPSDKTLDQYVADVIKSDTDPKADRPVISTEPQKYMLGPHEGRAYTNTLDTKDKWFIADLPLEQPWFLEMSIGPLPDSTSASTSFDEAINMLAMIQSPAYVDCKDPQTTPGPIVGPALLTDPVNRLSLELPPNWYGSVASGPPFPPIAAVSISSYNFAGANEKTVPKDGVSLDIYSGTVAPGKSFDDWVTEQWKAALMPATDGTPAFFLSTSSLELIELGGMKSFSFDAITQTGENWRTIYLPRAGGLYIAISMRPINDTTRANTAVAMALLKTLKALP